VRLPEERVRQRASRDRLHGGGSGWYVLVQGQLRCLCFIEILVEEMKSKLSGTKMTICQSNLTSYSLRVFILQYNICFIIVYVRNDSDLNTF